MTRTPAISSPVDAEGWREALERTLEKAAKAPAGLRIKLLSEGIRAALSRTISPETAEIERLREALERLIEDTDAMAWAVNSSMAEEAIKQARAALSATDKGEG